jgi:hypothetical protein
MEQQKDWGTYSAVVACLALPVSAVGIAVVAYLGASARADTEFWASVMTIWAPACMYVLGAFFSLGALWYHRNRPIQDDTSWLKTGSLVYDALIAGSRKNFRSLSRPQQLALKLIYGEPGLAAAEIAQKLGDCDIVIRTSVVQALAPTQLVDVATGLGFRPSNNPIVAAEVQKLVDELAFQAESPSPGSERRMFPVRQDPPIYYLRL